MEVALWIFLVLLGFGILSLITVGLAALTIFMGPPDAHDIELPGEPRKYTEKESKA